MVVGCCSLLVVLLLHWVVVGVVCSLSVVLPLQSSSSEDSSASSSHWMNFRSWGRTECFLILEICIIIWHTWKMCKVNIHLFKHNYAIEIFLSIIDLSFWAFMFVLSIYSMFALWSWYLGKSIVSCNFHSMLNFCYFAFISRMFRSAMKFKLNKDF